MIRIKFKKNKDIVSVYKSGVYESCDKDECLLAVRGNLGQSDKTDKSHLYLTNTHFLDLN